jgi:hypothetical protein
MNAQPQGPLLPSLGDDGEEVVFEEVKKDKKEKQPTVDTSQDSESEDEETEESEKQPVAYDKMNKVFRMLFSKSAILRYKNLVPVLKI